MCLNDLLQPAENAFLLSLPSLVRTCLSDTYDRLVFEFLDDDGKATVVPEQRVIRGNMILANYGCAWPLDHDDGSMHYLDTKNVLMYAGTKTYLGGHTMTTSGNLMLWPNLNGWGAATMCYSSAAGSSGYDEHWVSNTVVLGPPNVGTSRGDGYTDFSSCELGNWTNPPTPSTADNIIYTPSGNVSANCYGTPSNANKVPVPFDKWQASGRDAGSKVLKGKPSDEALVAHAKLLLGMTRSDTPKLGAWLTSPRKQ